VSIPTFAPERGPGWAIFTEYVVQFSDKNEDFSDMAEHVLSYFGPYQNAAPENGANPIIAMPHISDFKFRPRLQLSIAPPSAFRSKCYADIHVNCPRGKKGGMIFNCLTVGAEGRLALEAAVPPSSPNPSLSLPCDV
jgi:hypothetical protein